MEIAAAPSSSGAVFAGPSSEVSTPGPHEEDSRHFAITASQVPKPAGTMSPLVSQSPPTLSTSSEAASSKEAKSIGTRFHEDCYIETDLPSPRLRSSRMFKGKGKEAVNIEREERKPLRLLDLPVDILKDIVKEVTHTNDLTSLALCHSALHRLAIPHIYSRFDIVWPDTTAHAEPRSGVDALTYGLATLVMAEEVFGEAPGQRQERNSGYAANHHAASSDMAIRRRRGNHYAHFTRKFSLGNGPPDWVQEYLITKEGGKMLGTLVALAVARMRSLETFVWDMPTGILRDVWLALSSLGDRDDGKACRLERVRVRWHDNSSSLDGAPLLPSPVHPLSVPHAPMQTNPDPPSATGPPSHFNPAALDRVEHPSFSVLPPLASLSVLDIDELAYLDEMAVLIGRSIDKLRELRVGIARHAAGRDWVTVWEGDNLQQIDPQNPTASSLTIGGKRLGGVLGTLTGFVRDMRKPQAVPSRRSKRRSSTNGGSEHRSSAAVAPVALPATVVPTGSDAQAPQSGPLSDITTLRDVLPEATEPSIVLPEPFKPLDPLEIDPLVAMSSQVSSPQSATPNLQLASSALESEKPKGDAEGLGVETKSHAPHYLDGKLKLETLELERVPLSMSVLLDALDWTRLTSLTLMHCQNHEQLWKTLRRSFAPSTKSPIYPQTRRHPGGSPKKSKSLSTSSDDLHYPLNLKKIHTNTVSSALISFLKETLAPNSLEVLFLQEARSYSSSVSVDQIYKGPLRRHRNSLRKLLIDSAEKTQVGGASTSSRWRRWLLPRDILGFICGGKMPALRELGIAIDYKDWHFFLQHLPSIPHLRSLSLPHLADHVHGASLDPRELALQVVDIVSLRLECEICYMGIAGKCFEILEGKRKGGDGTATEGWDDRVDVPGVGAHEAEDDDPEDAEDDDDPDDDDDDDDDEDADAELGADDEDDEETESEDGDVTDSDSEGSVGIGGVRSAATKLRLREILFYDDKVAIFRARHGCL